MRKCKNCKYFCHDYSTGTSECARYDDMTEEETERYYVNDEENCPYWNDFESNDGSFLPRAYAEIEYDDLNTPEAMSGCHFDDMNYLRYRER